jgi:hypothetical protein
VAAVCWLSFGLAGKRRLQLRPQPTVARRHDCRHVGVAALVDHPRRLDCFLDGVRCGVAHTCSPPEPARTAGAAPGGVGRLGIPRAAHGGRRQRTGGLFPRGRLVAIRRSRGLRAGGSGRVSTRRVRLVRCCALIASPSELAAVYPVRGRLGGRGVGFQLPDGREWYFWTFHGRRALETLAQLAYPVSWETRRPRTVWRATP